MARGKIKFYELERGYGAVIDDETGRKITVYANDIVAKEDKEKLIEGQIVEFDIENNRNNDRAVNVRVINNG